MLAFCKKICADDAVFYSALLMLVGVSSFLLGQQSVASATPTTTEPRVTLSAETFTPTENGAAASRVQTATSEVVSKQNSSVSSAASKTELATGEAQEQYVASKSGSRYHLPSCPSASQINAENRIYFATVQAARAAGYTPAQNCPELQSQ